MLMILKRLEAALVEIEPELRDSFGVQPQADSPAALRSRGCGCLPILPA
jgi:hypothetical protein